MKQASNRARISSTRTRSFPIGAYGEGAEEIAIEVRQLEAAGGGRAASLGEEDPRLRAALEDLRHRVTGGLGGLERDLDRADQLAHEVIHVRIGWNAPYDSTGTIAH